jgi:hypothetical protein
MSAATPTRPLPTAVREKLGKPLLSSNLDGEWVGAVAAIERVLKSAGLEALRASRRFTAIGGIPQQSARARRALRSRAPIAETKTLG